jgi:hypothetical protein
MNEDHRFAHDPVLIKQPRAITALNVWNHTLQSFRFASRGQRPSELSGQDVTLTTMSVYSYRPSVSVWTKFSSTIFRTPLETNRARSPAAKRRCRFSRSLRYLAFLSLEFTSDFSDL